MDHTSPSSPATLPSLASRRPGHPRPLPPPTTTPQSPTTSSPTGSIKRRRSEFEGDDDDIKLHIANKKACDQCKQHKQKCDRDENEQKCRRCIKNNRGCSFTDGFKRTAKRDEHAARESEVVDLRAEIAELRGALVEKNSKIHELQATCDYLRRNGSINANNIGSGLISQTSFGTTPTMPPMTSRVTSSTPANYPIGLSSPSLTSPTNSHAFPYTPSSLPSSGPYANIDPAAFANPPSTTVPFRDNLTAPTYDTGIASHEADASHSLLRLSQRGHTDARYDPSVILSSGLDDIIVSEFYHEVLFDPP
ncbi:MAG: hypothetical protein M1821_001949 [Bathelium mastoideum]|nr:MAG: hypothetical protein M1821_001949 [Bathelium mastoideum]